MRGIILRDHEVRALLRNKRVLVVRLVEPVSKRQRKWLTPELLSSVPSTEYRDEWPARCGPGVRLAHPKGGPLGFVRCPWGVAGERRSVREAWQQFFDDEMPTDRPRGPRGTMGCPATPERVSRVFYRADGESHPHDEYGHPVWLPSTHMPSWASRLTIEVVSTKVARLHALTEDDAQAAGAERPVLYDPSEELGFPAHPYTGEYREGLRKLWDDRYGGRPWRCWEDNPWCWLGEMKVVEASRS